MNRTIRLLGLAGLIAAAQSIRADTRRVAAVQAGSDGKYKDVTAPVKRFQDSCLGNRNLLHPKSGQTAEALCACAADAYGKALQSSPRSFSSQESVDLQSAAYSQCMKS